jgi:AcrR family transcriptional regulator
MRQETTRRQLLRAGRKLFSERGLYESRIEDLTESAGIAKGTLYLYFRSKEELIQAVTVAGYEELREHVRSRLGRSRTTAGLLRAMTLAHLEFFTENPDLVRVFHQVRGMLKFPKPEWKRLRAPLQEHIDFLTRELGRASAPSRLGRPARRRAAIHLYGSLSGVTSVHSVLERETNLRRLLPHFLGSFGVPRGARPARPPRNRSGSR